MIQYIVYGVLIAGMLGYVKGCTDEKGRFDDWKLAQRAVGEAQEIRTKERIELDKKRKAHADQQRRNMLDDYNSLALRLRKSASPSLLPPAAPGAARPQRAEFDRTELDRALQEFREEVAGIVEEGDRARIDLDAAKRWANP